MTYLITKDNLLDGIGDYTGLPKHELLSMLPVEDRKQGLTNGLTRFIQMSWDRLETDSRDIDRVDISGTLPDEIIDLVKAAQCFYLIGILHRRNRTHAHDRHNLEYRDSIKQYERIRGRIRIQMPSGHTTNVGKSKRFVRA